MVAALSAAAVLMVSSTSRWTSSTMSLGML